MAEKVVNIHAAKIRLSQVVDRAEKGERIVIARAGKPVAELGPAAAPRRAVIDVHMHAGPAGWTGPGTPQDAANRGHLEDVLAAMDRNGVRLGVISGPMEFVEYWKSRASHRFVASVMLPCDGGNAPLGGRQCYSTGAVVPDPAWLRSGYSSGALGAMGEITAQYAGLSPADALLEPYFNLAEQLDIPVGVHTGLSYPGTPYRCCPKFRASLGRPLLLEEVLVRHPKLRLYAMHAGSPYVEEMLALMALYPQLHIDVSALNYVEPRTHFHAYLKKLIDYGMGKRILFGFGWLPTRGLHRVHRVRRVSVGRTEGRHPVRQCCALPEAPRGGHLRRDAPLTGTPATIVAVHRIEKVPISGAALRRSSTTGRA